MKARKPPVLGGAAATEDLAPCKAGDRVRLADGRVVELAFTIPVGTANPRYWNVREILPGFGTAEERSDLFELPTSTRVAEVIATRATSGRAEPGEEHDPLRGATQGKLL